MSACAPLELSDPIQVESFVGPMQLRHGSLDGQEAIAVTFGSLEQSGPILVRIHSSCAFSEGLGAIDCDCSLQLRTALSIAKECQGIVIYAFEEGRGAGLRRKFDAIRLQQQTSLNTAVAFQELGLPPDPRRNTLAIAILRAMVGDRPIELLTNNPNKVATLRDGGVVVDKVRPLVVAVEPIMRSYLAEKAQALGHDIDVA